MRDTATHKPAEALSLALPALRSTLDRAPSIVARLRALSHPHIRRVLDASLDDRTLTVVYAPLDGERLPVWLASHPHTVAPRIANARTLLDQVCQALTAAHRLPEPLAHGALAPWSLNVEPRGRQLIARVEGFGLFELASDRSGCRLPPELDPVDPRAPGAGDVFALGALLATLLTREEPPQHANASQIDAWITTHCPEASPSLHEIARACAAPDPTRRPRDIATLREMLREADWTPHERPVTPAPRHETKLALPPAEKPPPPPPPPPVIAQPTPTALLEEPDKGTLLDPLPVAALFTTEETSPVGASAAWTDVPTASDSEETLLAQPPPRVRAPVANAEATLPTPSNAPTEASDEEARDLAEATAPERAANIARDPEATPLTEDTDSTAPVSAFMKGAPRARPRDDTIEMVRPPRPPAAVAQVEHITDAAESTLPMQGYAPRPIARTRATGPTFTKRQKVSIALVAAVGLAWLVALAWWLSRRG